MIPLNQKTHTESFSYLKNHLDEIPETMTINSAPLIITQNGEQKFVLMDMDRFKKYKEYEETLCLLKMLADGQKQIKKGQFRPIEEVFKELEAEDPETWK